MSKFKIKPPSRWFLASMIASSIVGIAIGFWLLGGPIGHAIPEQLPDEANRVHHPAGFSIIAPPNWYSKIEVPSEPHRGGIALYPMSPGNIPRRWSASLGVSCYGQERPSDLAELAPTTFQGLEAYEQMGITEEGDAERPDRSNYVLLVNRGGRWFLITYRIIEARTTLPDIIRRYIETLRWEPEPTPPPSPQSAAHRSGVVMGSFKFQSPSRRELLVVGGILTLQCCVFGPIVWKMRGPRGDAIPKQPPDEANRVTHPAGFSIVAPPHWNRKVYGEPDLPSGMITMYPMEPSEFARRLRAVLSVTNVGQNRRDDLADLKATTFLGHEAYERMEVVRKDTFDDPAWSKYELIVRQGNRWFEVVYSIAEERTTLPDMVRRYIETIRWDPEVSLSHPPQLAAP